MRRHRAFAVALACSASAFATTRPAQAVPSARLVYVRGAGAESCPDEAAVRSAVAARLGYDPFFPQAASTMIADVEKVGDAFVAQLKLVGDDNTTRGARELVHRGPACSDMIDTMALSMSIAIDPDSLTRPPSPAPGIPAPVAEVRPESEATPSQESSSEPTASTSPPREAAPPPPARQHDALHLELGAGSAAFIGAAPSANASGFLFARLRRGALSAAVEGRVDLPASADARGTTVETRAMFVALVPCLHTGPVGLCAVGAFGRVHATSTATVARDDATFHGAVGPRVAAEVPITGPLLARAHVDVLYAWTAQTLEVSGRPVHELPRVSAGAGISLVVRAF